MRPQAKTRRRAVAGVAALIAIALLPPAATAAGIARRRAAAPSVPMGMNLAPVADYGTNLPFVDVFKASRDWIEKGGEVSYDRHGWPRLSGGRSVETLMLREIGGRYPEGEYVVTYRGTGDVELARFDVVDVVERAPGLLRALVAPGNGGLLLEVRSSDPSDPVRDVQVWMPGFRDAKKLFHPDFLERLRPFGVLRFMEWQRTNASPAVDWADRPRVEDARWSTARGVPLEVMIDLANELDADPWFTIPHLASDDYVRRFARLVKSRLEPDRKVWVEYSNEVWNSMFAQSAWAREQGVAAGLSDDPFLAQLRFYSERSVRVMEIFEEVFGGTDRLVRVAGSQAVSPWVSEKILEWKDAHRRFDALGIAPYFGGRFGKPETADEISGWSTRKLLEALREEIDGENRDAIVAQAEVARRFGLELVAYEGGQHLVGHGGAENDELLTDLFVETNRTPGMYDLYRRHLGHWAAAGGGLFAAFNDAGKPTKWGSWGAREWSAQPLSEAPKERALLDAAGPPARAPGRRVGVR